MIVHFLVSLAFVVFEVFGAPSIIIIGAGSSGIAAASKLFENGFENITILEAENRIGGRINSVYFGEGYIDLGAQWCHGEKNNIVYSLVEDYNILKPFDFPETVYLSSREHLDEEFSRNMVQLVYSFFELEDLVNNTEKFKNVSYGDYLLEQFNSSVYKKYGTNSKLLKDAKLFEDFLRYDFLSELAAFSWFDPAIVSDYETAEGHQFLNWHGFGFKTIIEILMKKFPNPTEQLRLDEHILLNKKVIKISWEENNTVLCSDGTIYQADYVIFTASVGVLKRDHLQLFSPPLPKHKQEAIDQIGFGAVIKVPIYYKTKWWDENFNGAVVVWTDQDKEASITEFPEGPIRDGQRWVTSIYNVMIAERNPNVLFIWFVGDVVPELEMLPDETFIKGIVFALNKCFGGIYNEIPKPDKFLRMSWYSNPHFRGTYSYQKVSTEKGPNSAEVKLSQPLLNHNNEPAVLFAGEATSPTHYSTVHGAIETGFREADRIINFQKNEIVL